MKLTRYMLPAAICAAMLASSCAEDPELPPVNGPKATYKSNTTILELKQQFWKTDGNYAEKVGLDERGDSIIVHGTVISSDATGNIYKSLMINDGTAALTVAVNGYDLYQSYQYGQEVYINVTGLYIGGYNGLMQLGGLGSYNGNPSMTFMTEDEMTTHAQQNGWGTAENAAKYIIETDIPELIAAKASAEGLQNWQSRLVKIDGLTFEDAGQQFAPTATTNRYLKDAAGNRINLRCSSYSDFAKDVIPAGTGSVTAILSYYGNDWQMLLIDLDGLQGFESTETPELPDGAGTKEHPLTVEQLVALNNPGTTGQWAEGVIVGVMNYIDGTGNVFSSTELTTGTNIVLAAAADKTDDLVAVQLPAGDLRTKLNLVDNPSLLGKTVAVCGDLVKYCNITGIKNTSAAMLDGEMIGSEPSDKPAEGEALFTRTTDIVSGGRYVLWTDNTVSNPMPADKAYNYLSVTKDVKLASETTLKTSEANAYTFTKAEKGWTIQDSQGIYLYMDDVESHNSFQLSKTLDAASDYYYWTLTATAEGRFEIENVGTGKLVQYSQQYTSYGAYPDRTRGSLPYLFQLTK